MNSTIFKLFVHTHQNTAFKMQLPRQLLFCRQFLLFCASDLSARAEVSNRLASAANAWLKLYMSK